MHRRSILPPPLPKHRRLAPSPQSLCSKRIGCWRQPTSVYHCPDWAKQRGDGDVRPLDSNAVGRPGWEPLSLSRSLFFNTDKHTHAHFPSLPLALPLGLAAHCWRCTAAAPTSLAAHQHPSLTVLPRYTLAAYASSCRPAPRPPPHPPLLYILFLICCVSPRPRTLRRHGDQPAGLGLLWHQHQVAAQVLGR